MRLNETVDMNTEVNTVGMLHSVQHVLLMEISRGQTETGLHAPFHRNVALLASKMQTTVQWSLQFSSDCRSHRS